MAERMLRRGLPRVAGGDPWPPALTVEVAEVPGAPAASVVPETPPAVPVEAVEVGPVAGGSAAASAVVPETPAAVPAEPVEVGPVAGMRRGLPRVVGGEAWPPADAAVAAAAARSVVPETSPAAALSPEEVAPVAGVAAVQASPAVPETPTAAAAIQAEAEPLGAMRRGLPRIDGGEAWPQAGLTPRAAAPAASPAVPETVPATAANPVEAGPLATAATTEPASTAVAVRDVSTPLPFRRTVWQGRAPRHAATAASEASRFRPTWTQALAGLMGAAALGIIAAAGVALVRAVLSMSFMQDFLAMYPGEYHLPETAPVGVPGWLGWQHFFNIFLMVLIIRSGLRVRSEKRPTVFWSPRGDAKGKISLTLWFHQALDILWLVNGVIFIVLLFVTGHWMRIVPTSWEVFPNALSALLQYISFDWPTENGWVNYNSLQQLAYFTTVFIAAPLAAVTGFRMSGMWPKKAERLSKAYPVEIARALHFPIMLYFVAFIVVHVALVMLTGMLRNLNHMFAAQGSVDPTAYAGNWLGFVIFVVAMLVVAGGWFAARPLVLAPIAKLFGQVSGR